MSPFKMNAAGLVALAATVLAQTSGDSKVVSTLPPQPLGTATTDGAVLASINYCSVVQLTQCQVSVMTSALPQEKYATPAGETTAAPVETSMSMPMPMNSTTTSSETMTELVPTHTAAPATTTAPMTAAAQHVKALPGAAWAAAIMAILCLL